MADRWQVPSEDLTSKTLTQKDYEFYSHVMALIKSKRMEKNESDPNIRLLKSKKQIVVQGAPARGKPILLRNWP